MKLKPKYKLSLIILASISVALTFIFSLRGKGVLQSENLTNEDTAKIIKPAVIRILQHSTGQVTIPKFEIDTKKFTLNILPTAPSDVQEVDSYIGGSGFVVNPDGYIITNAHVASENSIKDLYIESALTKAFTEKFGELTNESLEKNFENPDDYLSLYTEGLKLLKNNSVFNLKNEIVVLNPSDSQEYLTSLIKNSFPATRIWVNENYQLDDKDIALLKIDLKNLPSLLLANDLSLNVGSEILVFGFPSTAEVTYRSPLESTLTNGLVSAIKFSEKKNFKVFQTNAKISTGSSGGPLLNKEGKVVGVITFQTGGSLRQEGDSFAFAVPVELVKTVLQKNNIQNIEGEYNKKLKEALDYFHSNQCEVALKKFTEAENFNPEFTGPKYLDTYRDQCTSLTKQNLSLDSTFELTLQKIKNIEIFVWFVVLGRMMLILLAVFILAGLLKRMQKDEQHILALEIKIEESNQRRAEMLTMLENRGNPLPLPEPEMHAESRVALGLPQPHLKDFILEAKKIGIPDDEIKLELSKAGWDEKEILHTFGTLV